MSSENIYVIGDTQVFKGVRNPLVPVAWDIIETQPEKVVHLGDHFDFPSLSSYDEGKISFLSERYIDDVDAGNLALEEFWSIIEIGRLENPEWKCEFIFLQGNHENRRTKALDLCPPQMEGLLDLYAPDFSGWDKVLPFLKPYITSGIVFSHYLPNEFTGRAISTAMAGIKSRGCSFVAGHKQTLDTSEFCAADGRRVMGLIMGACYFHDEEYKGPQSNHHFRGTAYLRNAQKGQWEAEMRNLKTLAKKYE
jgi:hypothetical protein